MAQRSFYKVVSVAGEGKLYSAAVRCRGWRKRYIPNRWAEAETGLFVFRTLYDAKVFCSSEKFKDDTEIWQCQTEKSIRVKTHILGYVVKGRPKDFKAFWDVMRKPLKWGWNWSFPFLRTTPKGTAMYKRVKLLERV